MDLHKNKRAEMNAEEVFKALSNNPVGDRRVLSIQSHVVHGYAGNKCSVFPLQLHGFEVDPVNSVQFSNHSAYKHMKGEKLHDRDLSELYEGLKLNDINKYSHILTGYCANSSFLLKIADIVKDIRRENPKVLFVCDPVLGDNGEYYTPKELMPIYRDLLIPMANVITPNIFELSELAGQAVSNEAECLEAIEKMHKKGVSMVVVTSGLGTGSVRHCYASTVSAPDQSPLQYRFDFPELPGMYVGTGDVFSSLLIVWLDKLGGDLRSAVEKVIASLQELLKLTGLKAFGLPADDLNCSGSFSEMISEEVINFLEE